MSFTTAWVGCILSFFPSQTGRAHLLLLSKTPGEAGGAIGVITLEGEYFTSSGFHLPAKICFVLDIIEVGLVLRATVVVLTVAIGNHFRGDC